MLFHRALAFLLLSGSAAAFNVDPSGGKMGKMVSAANKNLANVFAVGVISASTLLPFQAPALAADSLVLGTPLEGKLAAFGAASYPVFNSIKDVSPLAEKFIEFADKKVKAPDIADLSNKAVDGLMAIPDSKVSEYAGILKQVVYSGVNANNCVTLGGSGAAAQKLAASSAIKSVDSSKIAALTKKFKPANSSVPVKGGNICLPGSVAASEKLWVAQAELTLSMPKAEGGALVSAIRKAGLQATRSSLVSLVSTAEEVFSKNPEAVNMAKAGRDVEPSVIATINGGLK